MDDKDINEEPNKCNEKGHKFDHKVNFQHIPCIVTF